MTTLLVLMTLSQLTRAQPSFTFAPKDVARQSCFYEPQHVIGTNEYGATIVQPGETHCFQLSTPADDLQMSMLHSDKELRMDMNMLRSDIEHDAHEFAAFRERVTQALAVAILALLAIVVGVELRLSRQTKELRRELRDAGDHVGHHVRVLDDSRRSNNASINLLLSDKAARDARDKEAAELNEWVTVNGHRYRARDVTRVECADSGSCALPAGHNEGETEIWHQDRVGRRWCKRHSGLDLETD